MSYSDADTETQVGKQKDINKFGILFNVDLWTLWQKTHTLINNNLLPKKNPMCIIVENKIAKHFHSHLIVPGFKNLIPKYFFII